VRCHLRACPALRLFEFDDRDNIFQEPHVLAGPSAKNIRWAMTAYEMGVLVPLTRLTYLLDQRFSNLNPGVMHVEDVLLHICGSVSAGLSEGTPSAPATHIQTRALFPSSVLVER
jgi:hypothetical protein